MRIRGEVGKDELVIFQFELLVFGLGASWWLLEVLFITLNWQLEVECIDGGVLPRHDRDAKRMMGHRCL